MTGHTEEVHRCPNVLCTRLWIACANTPGALCIGGGLRCASSPARSAKHGRCLRLRNSLLCAAKVPGKVAAHKWPEVVHMGENRRPNDAEPSPGKCKEPRPSGRGSAGGCPGHRR